MVRVKGLEPPRHRRQNLNLVRLPIPPHPHPVASLASCHVLRERKISVSRVKLRHPHRKMDTEIAVRGPRCNFTPASDMESAAPVSLIWRSLEPAVHNNRPQQSQPPVAFLANTRCAGLRMAFGQSSLSWGKIVRQNRGANSPPHATTGRNCAKSA